MIKKIHSILYSKLMRFSIFRKLYFEKEYKKKEDYWGLKNKKINTYKNKELLKVLNKINSNKNLKILDIGCGEGYSLNFINGHYKNITGVDISKIAIKRAKKNLEGKRIKLNTLDIAKNSLNEKFDLIISQEILYYIEDENIPKSIKNIKKMLNKNGTFINIEIINEKKIRKYKETIKKFLKKEKTINKYFDKQRIEFLIFKNK